MEEAETKFIKTIIIYVIVLMVSCQILTISHFQCYFLHFFYSKRNWIFLIGLIVARLQAVSTCI